MSEVGQFISDERTQNYAGKYQVQIAIVPLDNNSSWTCPSFRPLTMLLPVLRNACLCPRIIKGSPSRQAAATRKEGTLARVPSVMVAVEDLRPRGSLQVTFEEGTHSAWPYDLLSRRVEKLVVCNPRKNVLLKSGNKGDAIDARKLADLLRAGLLSPVDHGETSALEVQQLARSYLMLTEDKTRAMGRLKAVFRGQAISSTGRKLYGPKYRAPRAGPEEKHR